MKKIKKQNCVTVTRSTHSKHYHKDYFVIHGRHAYSNQISIKTNCKTVKEVLEQYPNLNIDLTYPGYNNGSVLKQQLDIDGNVRYEIEEFLGILEE